MRRGLRASFVLSRMAHARLLVGAVLAAILIAGALTTALAAYGSRAVPQAARHQVVTAPDLSVMITGAFGEGQAAADTAAIRASMQRAFGASTFRLETALWSNPLGLPPGTGASGHGGSAAIVLTVAAGFGHLTGHATLTAGSWPGAPRRGRQVPAALPAAIAGRLGLAPGDTLATVDRITGARDTFLVTGLYKPRGPASAYWGLNLIGGSGVSVLGDFVT